MKKIKKGLVSIAVGVSLASTFALASCGKAKEISYKFDVQGGTTIEDKTIKVGEEFTLPTPTKEGYKFLGWYDNQEFSGNAITTVKADSDTVFFAKWVKVYTVTLNANGGSVSQTAVELTEGENVYSAVSAIKASKGDLTFAGWYLNDTAIDANLTMGKEAITLTAKYKQSYTREYYYEKLDKSGYEMVAGEAGSAFIGDVITDTETTPGFSVVEKEDSSSTITVGESKSSNVIKKYYNRNSITVTFNTNYPKDTALENEEITTTVVYGNTVDINKEISCGEYLLLGYAATPDGEVVYSVDSIKKLFNAEETGIEDTASFEPTEGVTLYAKWAKPYTNMFGGVDELYVLDEDSDVIYLKRTNTFFVGEYDSEDKSFTFYDINEDILLEGKLNEDYSFSYSSEVRAGLAYTLFDGRSLNSGVTLSFDQYNGFKYVVSGVGDRLTTYKGRYTRNADNSFHAVFEDEIPEGLDKEFNFKVGTYKTKNAFQIRKESDVEKGEFLIYVLTGNMLDINPSLTFSLDGYGIASLGDNAYYYTLDDETGIITLQNTNGSVAGYLKIIDINGEQGVALYTEAYDKTFTNGTATLTMDGIGNVHYEDDETEFDGVYKISSTYSGKVICTVVQDNGLETKYVLTSTTEEEETIYSFTDLNEYYNEYVYQDATGAYYGPLVVTVDETHAELYAFVSKGVFQLVSKGTYALDPETGRYVYTGTDAAYLPADVEIVTTPVDASDIKSITYGIYEASSYTATYWYSYTKRDGSVVSLETQYKYYDEEKDTISDNVLLTFVANRVVFDNKNEGNLRHYEGTCSISGTIYSCTLEGMDGTLYVEIDKENGTFTIVSQPHTDYLYQDGNISKSEYLEFDKKNNVSYVVITKDEDGKNVENRYEGSYELTDKQSRGGSPIYKFTYEGGTFEFIRLQSLSGSYFAKYDEKYDKIYRNDETGEVLALDGFGFYAVYTHGEDETKLNYTVSEGYVTVTVNNYQYIFDVNDDDMTMELRGSEAGSYLVLVNQSLECYIDLDGHGNATLFTYVNSEKTILDDKATYTIYDSSAIMLHYTVDGEETAAIYKYTLKTVGNYKYKAFSLASPYGSMQLVDKKDWSILILDEYGFAELYSSEGVKSTGTYVLVADDLMYFFNDAGTDAFIYSYDKEAGEMLKGKLKLKGYYTEDLESLVFTPYGYAIFNGSDTAYYNEVDGEIFLYTYDKENPDANNFGYVKAEFGEFEMVKTYGGKTYYMNTGYDIDFARTEENSKKYPVTISEDETAYIENLYFAPTGMEFEVQGRVKLGTDEEGNAKYYTVTVTRKKLEDGTYETYFFLGNQRFDINIKYNGMDEDEESASTYEITGMRFEREFYNFDFLYMIYLYYSMTQQNMIGKVSDPYGGVKAVMVYDEEGNVVDSYLDSYFTEDAKITDSNGEVLNFNHVPFTLNSKDGTLYFYAKTTGSDEIEYSFYMMSVSLGSPFNVTGLRVVYITRPVHLETEDGYVLDMSQIVYYMGTNDVTKSSAVGEMYSIKMTKDDVEIPIETVIYDGNNNRYAISYTYDEETGKITATKYYKLNFTKEERLDNLAPGVTAVTIEVLDATTYYSEDGESYVDILADGTMKYLNVNGEFIAYTDLNYDEETKVYTFSVTVDEETVENYKLEIVDGKMVLTLISGDITEDTEEAPEAEEKSDDDLGA